MMSEDHLSKLLKTTVGDPPRVLDSDQLVRRAQRQRAKRGLGVGALALTLVVLVSFALLRTNFGHMAVPAGGATPSASASETTVNANCPPVLPDTDDAAADYLDLFVWGGSTYVATDNKEKGIEVGEGVTTIGCSIAELTASNHNLVGPMPWPDRTATFLPSGTKIMAVNGVSQACELIAQLKDGPRVYSAVDINSSDLRPRC